MWTCFDELSGKHGIQKMETVGYTYMAVGGLLSGGQNVQAAEITRMALDCCEEASKFMQPDGTPISVRVGVHTGHVLSGVVGRIKPQFSLFGDTVNTTARLQSTGERLKVHMSAVFRDCYLAASSNGQAGPEQTRP